MALFPAPAAQVVNGEPLTARDFVYAWRRLLSPEQASPSAGLLLATGINNAQSIYAGALDLDALGVEAESDQILKVILERPVPYFLQLISQRPFVPVNERAIAQFGKQWVQPGKMVSNGPTGWLTGCRTNGSKPSATSSTGMMPIPGSSG